MLWEIRRLLQSLNDDELLEYHELHDQLRVARDASYNRMVVVVSGKGREGCIQSLKDLLEDSILTESNATGCINNRGFDFQFDKGEPYIAAVIRDSK